MRKNIAAVIEAWLEGRPHKEATCRTDGVTVWSYALPIARRNPSGTLVVLDPEKAPSRTTKLQVRTILLFIPSAPLLEEI